MLRDFLHQHLKHVCRPGPPQGLVKLRCAGVEVAPRPGPHQHVWPPIKFTIKPDAVPHAIYTPAPVPVHWQDEVNKHKQLVQDVEFGIMKQVHTTMPTAW